MGSEEHRFPCENCGSDLRYVPGEDRMTCDHCGNTRPIENAPWSRSEAVAEQDLVGALRAGKGTAEMEETRTSSCPNCGARIEFDPAVHAKECPFCATPVVTDTGASRQIKPAAVLPFTLDEGAARAAMTRWLGSLWFAPNGLVEFARKGRKMSGVYTPCWTFDADTHSSYQGQRGTVYHERKSVMRNGKRETVNVPKVRWKRVRGRVARFFDDVLVVASTALPERFRRRLVHWDLTRLEPYQPEYLAGFRAEAYTIELEDAFGEARDIMDRQIQRDIKFDIGGDRQRIDQVDTKLSEMTFKHILVPVWIAAYKFRGRSFRFVVNGQTGEVAGERPWSTWKILLAVLAGLIVAAISGYLYAQGQST
ncbi:MAG: TFIIB-type zinc finger domain-containing protein [Pseudomonadota bacterium]